MIAVADLLQLLPSTRLSVLVMPHGSMHYFQCFSALWGLVRNQEMSTPLIVRVHATFLELSARTRCKQIPLPGTSK